MKRLLYSLVLAVGFSACAPLLAPPKEGIEGVPAWVRRRDREERAIAKRQIEAARLRQELRAERARAEEERRVAEAAAKQAELAAALASSEHAASEGSAVATSVLERLSPGSTTEAAGEGSGSGAASTSNAVVEVDHQQEGSGALDRVSDITGSREASAAPEGSGAAEAPQLPALQIEASTKEDASPILPLEAAPPRDIQPAEAAAGPQSVTAAPEAPVAAQRREREVQPLGITQIAGRGGVFFVPENLSGALPLLILFHGPGDGGAAIAEPFVDQARTFGFAIIAIDAVNKENGVWAFQINNAIVHRTKEGQFLNDAMDWVSKTQGVRFDRSRTLVAGYSQGASIAAWTGTNERFVSHFALLHGGFLSDGIGYEVRPVWLSTGDTDDFRTPTIHASTARSLRMLGLKDVTSRVFTTDSALSKEECESLIQWWLGPTAAPAASPVP